MNMPVLETERLLLVPAHPRLARASAAFYEKNKDFLLPREVAIVIAQIACYNGCLPQGAPSSPIITNLICQVLDMRLLKIAKKYKLDYTRYADDFSFSTIMNFLTKCKT